jgi:hypothetical protein
MRGGVEKLSSDPEEPWCLECLAPLMLGADFWTCSKCKRAGSFTTLEHNGRTLRVFVVEYVGQNA